MEDLKYLWRKFDGFVGKAMFLLILLILVIWYIQQGIRKVKATPMNLKNKIKNKIKKKD